MRELYIQVAYNQSSGSMISVITHVHMDTCKWIRPDTWSASYCARARTGMRTCTRVSNCSLKLGLPIPPAHRGGARPGAAEQEREAPHRRRHAHFFHVAERHKVAV